MWGYYNPTLLKFKIMATEYNQYKLLQDNLKKQIEISTLLLQEGAILSRTEDGTNYERVPISSNIYQFNFSKYKYFVEVILHELLDINYPLVGRIINRKDSKNTHMIITQTEDVVIISSPMGFVDISYKSLYEEYEFSHISDEHAHLRVCGKPNKNPS